jgi:hypothetical protein
VRHFLSFFAAKILGKKHIHWKYHNSDVDMNFNKLFDISKIVDIQDTYNATIQLQMAKQLISMVDQSIAKYFNINTLFSKEHVQIIKDAYIYKGHTSTFSHDRKNVAVHVRRGDISHMPFCDRYTDLDFFIRTIREIHSIYPDADFHIYSDSDVDLGFKSSDIRIFYHATDNILDIANDMIASDILVMSIGSNVSHFAGLLNEGIVYFDKDKLIPCFNNRYNIYWSEWHGFIHDRDLFLQRIGEALV